MEKPRIRAVGNASQEEKELELRKRDNLFHNHLNSLSERERVEIEKFEYPKTPQELALIEFANEETGRLMKEAGVEEYDIPEENFHIVPAEIYNRRFSGQATTSYERQGIVFNASISRRSAIGFGSTATHEALHLKSFQAIEVSKGSDGKIETHNYRGGVRTDSLQRHVDEKHFHQHFRGLDEGIVSIQQKRSFHKMLSLPTLREERAWMESDKGKQLRRECAEKIGAPESDVIWVSETGNEFSTINYPKQREVVEYVCNEIVKEFPEKYKNFDEIFQEFLKAHFTGNILTIGRLVEETFGEGGFRTLGNTISDDPSSTVLQLETLKQARRRVKKSK